MGRLLGLAAFGRRGVAADTQPPAFAELAESYRTRDLLEEAKTVCEQGLSDFPSYVSGHIVMAKIHRDAGALEAAERSARKALQLDPMNAIALSLIGDLALRRGEWDEAARYLEDALFFSPMDAHAAELLKLAQQRKQPIVTLSPGVLTAPPAPEPAPAAPVAAGVRPGGNAVEREVSALRQLAGIEGALLLSDEGLPVSGSLGSGNDTDEQIAALAASVMAEWEVCSQLPPPRPKGYALMETENSLLVLAAAGAWILLVAVSGHIRPGRVLGNIYSAAERIAHHGT